MMAGLKAEGVDNIELWFMQIGTHAKSPEEVGDLLSDTPAAVLEDDPEQTIWALFASTWYEAVLLDPENCIVAHFGPFLGDAPPEEEIVPLWKGAALGTLPCDDPEPSPEPSPGPSPHP
ncbi:MAG: hypothetical protein FJ098_16700, partial [Deltaproteobacteria bacterium]|nr:hypothetical protein [Deltaproteobacteria bacterium]